DLAVASDEPSKSTGGRSVESLTKGCDTGQLISCDRDRESFEREISKKLDLDQVFNFTESHTSHQVGIWRGHFLHPGCQMCGRTDRGIIDIQIVGDRANHHLPLVQSHSDSYFIVARIGRRTS